MDPGSIGRSLAAVRTPPARASSTCPAPAAITRAASTCPWVTPSTWAGATAIAPAGAAGAPVAATGAGGAGTARR